LGRSRNGDEAGDRHAARKKLEEDDMTDRGTDEREAILAEVRKTRETAERMANGEGPPSEADDIRVLAGMVHQVAEQVERLVQLVGAGSSGGSRPDSAA
jgi:cytochrome c556